MTKPMTVKFICLDGRVILGGTIHPPSTGPGIHDVELVVNGSRFAWSADGNPLRGAFSIVIEVPDYGTRSAFVTEGDGPVFADEWRDEEWHALAGQHYQRELTPEEGQRYINGPRSHPFDFEAYCVLIGGRTAIFRSKEAYEKWRAAQPDSEVLP